MINDEYTFFNYNSVYHGGKVKKTKNIYNYEIKAKYEFKFLEFLKETSKNQNNCLLHNFQCVLTSTSMIT